MFHRTKRETYTATRTIGGVEAEVELTRDVPRPPRDLDGLVLRGVTALVLALTVATVVWSTYAISEILHGGVGYAVAVVFDLGWAASLGYGWVARREPAKRKRPKAIGWFMLVVTMAAIFWHGVQSGSVAMGIVGSAGSLFCKLLWETALGFLNVELAEADAAWIRSVKSQAAAELAVAQTMRQVARVRAVAALSAPAQPAISAPRAPLSDEPRAERPELAERAAERPALSAAHLDGEAREISAERTPTDMPAPARRVVFVAPEYHDGPPAPSGAPAQPAELSAQPAPFGFAPAQSAERAQPAQSAERAQRVAQVRGWLSGEPALTSAQVAERLSVSGATARRYLAEARGGAK